jgi:hypothetical protein
MKDDLSNGTTAVSKSNEIKHNRNEAAQFNTDDETKKVGDTSGPKSSISTDSTISPRNSLFTSKSATPYSTVNATFKTAEKDHPSNNKNNNSVKEESVLQKSAKFTTAEPQTSSSTSSQDTITSSTTSLTLKRHNITNNFKLPPFPVYVPSTNITSSFLSLNDASKNETTTSPSSKSRDITTTISASSSTGMSHLSNVSSYSPSSKGMNTDSILSSPPTLNLNKTSSFLYQSESSNLSNFNNVNIPKSLTINSSNNEATVSSTSPHLRQQQTNYTSIQHTTSTLPKTSSGDSYVSKFSADHFDKSVESSNSYSSKYSTDYYSNIATTTSNGTSTYTTSSSLNDSIYRVQYSATNPFLDPSDANPGPAEDNKNGSAYSRSSTSGHSRNNSGGIVSEIARKFEKFDYDGDLK